jgi:MSHA biogenesis protein MshJ
MLAMLKQKLHLQQLQEKIDARIMRERVLIFLSAIALVYLAWSFIIQTPIDKKTQATQEQIDTQVKQNEATTTQIAALTQALLNDPTRIKQAQIEQLQKDVAAAEAKLQSASQHLIKAEQLPQALQDVLQKTAQLTLLEVATLPAHELKLVTADSIDTKNVAANFQDAGVYEHVVELRVSGNYFQVLNFLTALEALPWRFYWQRLDYTVLQYPNAEIILRVYTLSSEEGLLGV